MPLSLMNRIFVGEGFHRSGWPHAMYWLHTRKGSGPLLDDFVEQTFLYGGQSNSAHPHARPWVGIFHHPPCAPNWFWRDQRLQTLWECPSFTGSLPNLKGAIALSEYLACHLREMLDVPVATVKHPCAEDAVLWGEGAAEYEARVPRNRKERRKGRRIIARRNPWVMPTHPRLLSFGWYMRDTRILNRVPPGRYTKLRLWPGKSGMSLYDEKVVNNLGPGKYSDVEVKGYVSNSELDILLATSIVVCGVVDASATNGVIDCIARNTPIIVNRHPAVQEYLGQDYPLYYEHPDQIPALVDRAAEGNEYMKSMDKSWLSGERFAEQVEKIAMEAYSDR